MRKLSTGDCRHGQVFELVDPTQFRETAFEAEVVKALACLMPEYRCGVFAGSFVLEGVRHLADLALLHPSLSHWFVVEVEIAGHSLEHHVLPQVRCFRFGEAEASCVASLVRAFSGLTAKDAEHILAFAPRHVAVISNRQDPKWTTALDALNVQHLSVSVYRDGSGKTAHELEGSLLVRAESLGFAQYSETDNCLRISKSCGLPTGEIQIADQFGVRGVWVVREEAGVLWVSKARGPALLGHNSYVHLVRAYDGSISLHPST